jgi:tetratricopeptide (TPR) repeat protein
VNEQQDQTLGSLRTELQRLYTLAGRPSTRRIAQTSRDQGHPISHSSVHMLLRCEKVPRWPMLQAVVAACGGDEESFRSLWGRAWQAANPDVRIEHPEPDDGLPPDWAEPGAVTAHRGGQPGAGGEPDDGWWAEVLVSVSQSAAAQVLSAAARTNITRTARVALRLASRDGLLSVMQWMCTRDALRVAQILDAVAVNSVPVVTATIAGLEDPGLIALHSAIRTSRPNLLPIFYSVLGVDGAPGLLTRRCAQAPRLAAAEQWGHAEGRFRALVTVRQRILGEEHPDTSTARFGLAECLHKLDCLPAARREYRLAWLNRARRLGEDHPDTLAAQHAWSLLLPNSTGVKSLREVVAGYSRTLGETHTRTLQSRADLAACYEQLGHDERAEDHYLAIVSASVADQKVDIPRMELLGQVAARRALLHLRAGRDDAEDSLRRCLRELDRQGSAVAPPLVELSRTVRAALAQLMAAQQRWGEEVEHYDHLLRGLPPLTLHGDATVLDWRYHRAAALRALGRAEEAEREYREIADAQSRIHGPADPHTLATRHQLGNLLRRQQRLPEAEREYTTVLRERQRQLAEDDPDLLAIRHHLATVWTYQGKLQLAITAYRDILETRRRKLGADHRATSATWTRLAAALALANDWDAAATEYQALLEHLTTSVGPNDPATISIRQQLSALVAHRAHPTLPTPR